MKRSSLNKISIFLVISCLSCIHEKEPDLTCHVDVFIGVDRGNTFPGAKLPFSLMSVSPVSDFPLNDWSWGQWTQCYRSNRPVLGLSHTHLSGTGGGGRYCNFLVSAHSGIFEPGGIPGELYSEDGQPGYYTMELEGGNVKVEATLTPGVGFHRYTFRGNDTASVSIDAAFTVHSPTGADFDELTACKKAWVEIISDQIITGSGEFAGGWGRPAGYQVYFAAAFNRPFLNGGCWKGNTISFGTRTDSINGNSVHSFGAAVLFSLNHDSTVQMKLAVSYESVEKALRRLESCPGWNFDEIRNSATEIWQQHLKKIQVYGGTVLNKRLFFTSLYHTMFSPRDITGESIHGFSRENPQYTDYYCLWDTYRAQNPLLMLIMPDRQAEMISSLLEIYTRYGWLPDAWGVGGYLVSQGGSNADIVISEAIQKGICGFDYDQAMDAMLKNALEDPKDPGRYGLSFGRYVSSYDKYGYLPLYTLTQVDTFPCPVSRSLEYAYNDYCIALAAKKMGREEIFGEFVKRSERAMNLFHPEKKLFWAKNEMGDWYSDYDPAHFFHPWTGPYYEGSAYQYSMGAPHLIGQIIASHGGTLNFTDFLDHFFEGGYYTPTNEPNLHIPWLYIYAGRPDRASFQIRNLMTKYYTDKRDGLPGDDDSGTMSAWFVWASLGIYAMPGTDIYLIASPVFERAVIELQNGKKLTIRTKNLSEKNIYVNSATLNGHELERAWFRHREIVHGADIELVMSDKPNSWGTSVLPGLSGDNRAESVN